MVEGINNCEHLPMHDWRHLYVPQNSILDPLGPLGLSMGQSLHDSLFLQMLPMLYHPNFREHPFLSVRLGGTKLQPDLLETYERIAQSQERILL